MFDALILAGGGARRMGGADKTALTVGGTSLLERVLAASAGAGRTVIVGPERATSRPVYWTREQPAGRGPVAALKAGLALVVAERVVLLAGDLPFLAPAVLARLLAAVQGDGAMLVDDEGRDQFLCSAWRTSALRSADLTADRLGRLFAGLDVQRVRVRDRLAPWTDCDTEADLQRARELCDEHS